MAQDGWAALGDLLSGNAGREARTRGALQGLQASQLSAKTEEALAKARIEREVEAARQRLKAQPAESWTSPDQMLGDMVAAGYGSDYSGTMQGRNYGQIHDLRAGAADPNTPWPEMQRNLAAIDGKPVNPVAAVGAGGSVNIMDERPTVESTPLGDSLIGENQANAWANQELAKYREAQRTNPTAYRASGSEPLVQVDSPEGAIYVPRSQAAGQRPSTGRPKTTADNQNAAGFYDRMTHAETLLGDYAPDFKDFAAVGSVLGGGALTSTLANQVMSDKGQSYYQAAADWVRAKLRKESGAAIGKEEMLNEIRTYFPVPGDTPEVIAQKQQARRVATHSMLRTAGPALDQNANQRTASPQTTQTAPVRVNTPTEAMALPSGTRFMTPDGRVKVRP